MIGTMFLAVQAAVAAANPALPPRDWTALPPLRYTKAPATVPSEFVRSEVKAGRCAAATPVSTAWILRVELAVLVGASGQPRRVVPRAINCPAVEQYAAGLISSMARGNLDAADGAVDGWHQTSLTFTWTE